MEVEKVEKFSLTPVFVKHTKNLNQHCDLSLPVNLHYYLYTVFVPLTRVLSLIEFHDSRET